MPLRFAAARHAALPIYLPRACRVRVAAQAANDNVKSDADRDGQVLRAALRHFARFGLNGAAEARDRARTAHYSGDRTGYLHWLEICRALDRRMATALATNLAKRPPI